MSPRPRQTEQALVNAVIRYLGLRRYFVWRQNQGAFSAEYKGRKRYVQFTSITGVSDVIGLTPDGRFLAVECKIWPNKPTQNQLQFLQEVERRGGIAIVAYSLDDVIRGIDDAERTRAQG